MKSIKDFIKCLVDCNLISSYLGEDLNEIITDYKEQDVLFDEKLITFLANGEEYCCFYYRPYNNTVHGFRGL